MDFQGVCVDLQECRHGVELPQSQDCGSVAEKKNIDAWKLEADEQQDELASSCDEQLVEHLGNEHARESSPCACSGFGIHHSAIDVLSEEGFGEGKEWEEEHTPEKAIIQTEMHDCNKVRQVQPGNELGSMIEVTQEPDSKCNRLLKTVEKHEVVEDLIGSNAEHHLGEEVSLRIQGRPWQKRGTESSLVRMLWRQIESLTVRERQVEQTLSKERIEHLVSKVEEEVELEGMVEDMCLRFRAEGEFMDMERREREWERERHEVQLEEEVGLLRSKVDSLEEEIRIANAEKEYALQKKQEEIDDLTLNMQALSQGVQGQQACGSEVAIQPDEEKVLAVVRTRQQELFDESGESMLAALREMLCLAEEKAEQDRKALEDLEDTFHNEHRRWNDIEQQLEGQIYGLEVELNSMKDTLKEKASIVSLERERRRNYGLEVDKIIAFWREESSTHNRVCQRLKYVEDFLAQFGQKAMQLKTLSSAGKTIEPVLSELLRDLERVETEKQEVLSPSKCQQFFEWELIKKWKAQRDLLEDERDKLEERFDLSMSKAKDNEKRIEAIWREKERNLAEKLRNLEARLENQEIVWKRKNEAFFQEKVKLELEIDAYRKNWEEEREKGQAIMLDREQWMDEQIKEWACLLDVKDEELSALRSVQKKLADVLSTSKRRLIDIKRQLVRNRKGNGKGSRSKGQKGNENFDDKGDWCTGESDLETVCSKDFAAIKERQGIVDSGDEEYCIDVEHMAMDMVKEIGKLAREIKREQERLERERTEVRIGTEHLKDERRELERKVADALSLMEDLKGQIKEKEGQMEWERKQMELILVAKTDEVENLKVLLRSKEQEANISLQKFKDDMQLIEKEVEKERKEREEVMDLHFASRMKVTNELKEKEAVWEKETEAMSQELQELRAEIDEKDQEIARLRKESLIRDDELKVARAVWGNLQSGDKKQMSIGSQDSSNTGNCERLTSAEDMSNENLALVNTIKCNVETPDSGNSDTHVYLDRRDAEWQDAIEKIASFDKQIAEAMLAIQSLKEELSTKEKELQRARLERDFDSKTAWLHEQDQLKEIQEQHRLAVMERQFDWSQREQALLRDKDELLKLLEAERADTADAMSILQGAVRELQWALKQYKGKEDEDSSSELDRDATMEGSKFSTKGDLVKVHASHLEEVDQFILELKLKVEEAESRARAAEVALAVNAVKAKEAAKARGITSALVKFRKEGIDNDRSRLTTGQDEVLPLSFLRDAGFQSLSKRHTKNGRGFDDYNNVASNSLDTLQHEEKWSRGSEHGRLWDAGVSRTRLEGASNGSSSSWMTVRGAADDSIMMHDPFQQGALALAVSTPPPRSQRKWLVDASWLENVRKEQASLRQQLELERHRVSTLAQVEAENRWMQSTVMEALEQKRDSDTRVLELERKVAFLEAMVAKKGGRERSPSSSPYYRGAKS